MRHASIVTIILVLLLEAGCSSTRVGSDVRVGWSPEAGPVGTIVLLQEMSDVKPADKRDEKTVEVALLAGDALAALPGATVVDASALQLALGEGKPWRQASEHELVMAARQAGIDTICRLHVDQYTGYLAIGFLPLPGWAVDRRVSYDLRMLDAATGALRVDASRDRCAGGYLSTEGAELLKHDFAVDLREVLSLSAPEI
jgi:hypothetical protein